MKGKLFIALIFLFAACSEDDPITPQQQLEKDIATIDQYLASHGITNAIKDVTGVRIVVHTLGDLGLPPIADNEVVANYTGKLLSNGYEFDSGTADGKLSDWIAGWRIALGMLPEGSTATVYIPSGWAYGTQSNSEIPANSNLVFDIELESVTPTSTQTARLTMDSEDIDAYLTENSITVSTHSSGLRYVITQEGTGDMPTLYDQVKVSIKGKRMDTGTQFLNVVGVPSEDFSGMVVSYLPGMMVGFQQMKVGGKATLYVPSGLAYGPTAYTNLPANSNVIFELELLEIL